MTKQNYYELLNIRNEKIDDVENWLWVKDDDGAWEGPRLEWPVFREMYIKYSKKFDLVVQAGGNLGMYPRLLSNIYKEVYTFEPDHLNFHCLVNNCQKDNIYKFNVALGDRHEMLQMKKNEIRNVGMHRMLKKKGNMPTLMIDDFEFDNCDLIQLDIEDFEIFALKGAIKTIEKFKPLISVEKANDVIYSFLKNFGYKEIDKFKSDTFFSC